MEENRTEADAVEEIVPRADKRVDRRVTKTKAAIHQALKKLLEERGIDAVTVTALATEADIDRKTFYTHYRTLEDVLDDMAAMTIAAMVEQVDMTDFYSDPGSKIGDLIKVIIDHVDQEPLFSDRYSESIAREKLVNRWGKHLSAYIINNLTPASLLEEEEMRMVVQYYIGGMTSMIIGWLKAGRPISADEFADLAFSCVFYGFCGLPTISKIVSGSPQ